MFNFISTQDKEVAEKLRNKGFYEVSDTTDRFVFVNKPFTFEETDIDKSKIRFTNKLCI